MKNSTVRITPGMIPAMSMSPTATCASTRELAPTVGTAGVDAAVPVTFSSVAVFVAPEYSESRMRNTTRSMRGRDACAASSERFTAPSLATT